MRPEQEDKTEGLGFPGLCMGIGLGKKLVGEGEIWYSVLTLDPSCCLGYDCGIPKPWKSRGGTITRAEKKRIEKRSQQVLAHLS